jgi:hypothetical protein
MSVFSKRSIWNILSSFGKKKRSLSGVAVNCQIFIREGRDNQGNIYVEIHPSGGIKVYAAKRGIVPQYMPESYDDWCLEYLDESYVFADEDQAKNYFRKRGREDMVKLITDSLERPILSD